MEHLTREEILQLYKTRGETNALLDAVCKRRGMLLKRVEWAGKEEGYPVCPFCEVEFPGPHREGCEAFTAEGEVR